jgi:hypothetical protein
VQMVMCSNRQIQIRLLKLFLTLVSAKWVGGKGR